MPNGSRYSLDNLHVLAIDDNRHMRMLLQSILNALGVGKVTETGDATQAFEDLAEINPDLVIVDWHMEPLNGIEFARKVRTSKESPNPYLPIIMLSGYSDLDRVTEARDVGVNEFLGKPVSGKSLYSRFVTLIDNPRPFVRTKTYFGPDRRRQKLGPPNGTPERRKESAVSSGRGDAPGRQEQRSRLSAR